MRKISVDGEQSLLSSDINRPEIETPIQIDSVKQQIKDVLTPLRKIAQELSEKLNVEIGVSHGAKADESQKRVASQIKWYEAILKKIWRRKNNNL